MDALGKSLGRFRRSSMPEKVRWHGYALPECTKEEGFLNVYAVAAVRDDSKHGTSAEIFLPVLYRDFTCYNRLEKAIMSHLADSLRHAGIFEESFDRNGGTIRFSVSRAQNGNLLGILKGIDLNQPDLNKYNTALGLEVLRMGPGGEYEVVRRPGICLPEPDKSRKNVYGHRVMSTILAYVIKNGRVRPREIAESTSVSPENASRAIRKLYRRGGLRRVSEGLYVATSRTKSILEEVKTDRERTEEYLLRKRNGHQATFKDIHRRLDISYESIRTMCNIGMLKRTGPGIYALASSWYSSAAA